MKSSLATILLVLGCIAPVAPIFASENPSEAGSSFEGEDFDLDGSSNVEEALVGTLPDDEDTDGDTLLDGLEAVALHPDMRVPAAPKVQYAVIDLGAGAVPTGLNDRGEVLLLEPPDSEELRVGRIWKNGSTTSVGSGKFFRGPLLDGKVYFAAALVSTDEDEDPENDADIYGDVVVKTRKKMLWTPSSPAAAVETGVFEESFVWTGTFPAPLPETHPETRVLVGKAKVRQETNWGVVTEAYNPQISGPSSTPPLENRTELDTVIGAVNDYHDLMFESRLDLSVHVKLLSGQDAEMKVRSETTGMMASNDFYSFSIGYLANPNNYDAYAAQMWRGLLVNNQLFGVATLTPQDEPPEPVAILQNQEQPIPDATAVFDLNEQTTLEGPYILGTSASGAAIWCYNDGQMAKLQIGGNVSAMSDDEKVVSRKISSSLVIPSGDSIWRNGRQVPIRELTSATDYSQWNLKFVSPSENLLAGTATVESEEKAVLLVPVEMTWKAQDGYENVEDNKKVTAVDANDTPTERKWMDGHGRRIFPDKKNPTDSAQNRNRSILHVKGGIPNYTIYLKSFDVDDATPDSVDNDPAHKLDPNGKAGDDNMDTVNLRSGKFVSSGSNAVTVTLDNNGEADVAFETTKQPGDNFRVAAAFKQEDLNVLQVSNPDGKGFIEGGSAKANGFNGVVSPMLTVWRRLWLEFDSMGPPPASKADQPPDWELNHDEGVVFRIDADTPSAGQSTLRLYVDNPSPANVGQLTQPGEVWENGRIDIAGVGSFDVISASNQSDYAEVVIDGTPGSSVVNEDFKMYDDDALQIGSRPPRALPYQLSGGSLIYTAYADAFIEPIKVPASFIQTNVPFKRNISVTNYFFDWMPVVSSNRSLEDTEDFWAVYLLCSWQSTQGKDKDPDAEEPWDVGQSDPGMIFLGKKNFGTIYIETVREIENLPTTPRTEEQHAVVHEIGHQGGGLHTDGGIMTEGAPSSENQFKPITIKRFRVNRGF